ncbi:MAG: holo-ACP synthase [Candidatus Omnitrophica bacterium]|jgi:holo-[acyl-carrier protein] synthase|nr:holo-ACP synthase [Candidatus Omnitrophota bacterium]
MIIGTGVDITEVNRLRKAIEKWGDSFTKRVFTNQELVNAKTRSAYYQHLAGRFAAKEAVFKALGDKNLSWHDLQILNDKDGKPYCELIDGKKRSVDIHISISHVKNYAVANAIVTKKEKHT